MAQSNIVLGIRVFFVDLIGGIIKFPFWWYTTGLKIAAGFCFGSIKNQWLSLGVGVWLRNLFVPMYGETTIAGKIISFFARLAMIVGKSIWFVLWSLILMAAMLLYLIIVPITILNILYHLLGFSILLF